ncbi:hypothetical protein Tco_0145272 [Tanacetum coccineum]
MTGPIEDGDHEDREESPPLTKEQIEGHIFALNSLIKDHNKNKVDPIRLDFREDDTEGEWPMPVWCRMFQQTLDGSGRGWFECLPANSINEWSELREAFASRFQSFMDSLKCQELAKHFLGKVPATVNEIMRRLDDFVRWEEAFARTKLPKGESGDQSGKFNPSVGERKNVPLRPIREGNLEKAIIETTTEGITTVHTGSGMSELLTFLRG